MTLYISVFRKKDILFIPIEMYTSIELLSPYFLNSCDKLKYDFYSATQF